MNSPSTVKAYFGSLSDDDAIRLVVADGRTCVNGIGLQSTFTRCHEECKAAAEKVRQNEYVDRNGCVVLDHYTDVPFLAVIGYFCLLDHIGTCYAPKCPKYGRPKRNRSIRAALERFWNDPTLQCERHLNQHELDALGAARNAMVHEFGVVRKGQKPYHIFSYVFNEDPRNNKCIDVVRTDWNGKLDANAPAYTAVLYVDCFIGFADNLVEKVKKMALANELRCVLEKDTKELLQRHMMRLEGAAAES